MKKGLSGKFVLRISPSLHQTLREISAKSNSSLNMVCEKILSSSISQERQSIAFLKVVAIAEPLLEAIIRAARRNWGGELLGIVLFGSAVRQEEREDSDTDLLLVLQPEVSVSRKYYEEWNQIVDQIQPQRPQLSKISPHFAHLPKDLIKIGGLWCEVAIEGIILWQRGNEVQHTLINIRHIISEGKIQRKYSHGHPYWIKIHS
jgi:predicted nucleotidyltransferase